MVSIFHLVVVKLCLKSIGKEIWTKYVGTTNDEQNSNRIRLSIQIRKTWMYVNDLLLCNSDHFYFHFCFHHSMKKYSRHLKIGVARCLTSFSSFCSFLQDFIKESNDGVYLLMSLLNEIQNDQMPASTAKKSRIEEFNKTLVIK